MNISIKEAKKLLSAHYRKKTGLCLVEGEKVINSIIQESPNNVEQIYISEEKKNLLSNYDIIKSSDVISKSDMISIKQTKTSQGIFAVVSAPKLKKDISSINGNVVIFDSVSNPDNMGSMIRTALSFGWQNFIFIGSCVSLNNNTLIRASSGYLYKGNYFVAGYIDIDKISKNKHLYIADLSGKSPEEYDLRKNQDKVILLGNEGQGVSQKVYENIRFEKNIVTLSMNYHIDSISVAHASAVLFYLFK